MPCIVMKKILMCTPPKKKRKRRIIHQTKTIVSEKQENSVEFTEFWFIWILFPWFDIQVGIWWNVFKCALYAIWWSSAERNIRNSKIMLRLSSGLISTVFTLFQINGLSLFGKQSTIDRSVFFYLGESFILFYSNYLTKS